MSPKQEIGLSVPSFRLGLLHGAGAAAATLESILLGKRGALIAFWSGVCSHCRRYDDYFNSFARRHPEIGFATIASRRSETRDVMLAAVQDRHLTFPILVDEDGRLARQYFAQQTPRCYLVDDAGRLLYRGAIDNFKMPADPEYVSYLEPAIASFLTGEPITRPETASFGCAIETVYYQIPGQL